MEEREREIAGGRGEKERGMDSGRGWSGVCEMKGKGEGGGER